MKKIAIIGAGNMGGAIAASLVGADFRVVCTAKTKITIDRIHKEIPGVEITQSNVEAVSDADIIVLAVKPYISAGVIEEINPVIKPGAIVLSVVATLSLADLNCLLHSSEREMKIMRVIPNTAIRLGKSVTFIAPDSNVDADTLAVAEGIFNRSGKAFVIEEKSMGACMALASCGIAYFLRFIRAAAEGSVELGLRPTFATQIAALTAEGAAALLADGAHPEAEIDKVTTPGGITIKGLNALEVNGFTNAVIEALRASCVK